MSPGFRAVTLGDLGFYTPVRSRSSKEARLHRKHPRRSTGPSPSDTTTENGFASRRKTSVGSVPDYAADPALGYGCPEVMMRWGVQGER